MASSSYCGWGISRSILPINKFAQKSWLLWQSNLDWYKLHLNLCFSLKHNCFHFLSYMYYPPSPSLLSIFHPHVNLNIPFRLFFISVIWLIVHTTSLYLIIALLLLMYTQGSVLDPMLFTMYIKPLSAIIDSHYHTSFICWWLTIADVCSPRENIWATSLYVVMYKWCQSLGNCEHA